MDWALNKRATRKMILPLTIVFLSMFIMLIFSARIQNAQRRYEKIRKREARMSMEIKNV